MHTRAEPAQATAIGTRGRLAELARQRLLLVLSEQVAMPRSQLRRYLGEDGEATDGLLASLADDELIELAPLIAGEEEWAWPTRAGARESGTGFGARRPSLKQLRHLRAITEVRLELEERASEGRWVSERFLAREMWRKAHIPDGVFEVGGERHAIEVELSRKRMPDLVSVVAEHCRRYDLVVYFCSKRVRSALEALAETGKFPNLLVRDVPSAERTLATWEWVQGSPGGAALPPLRQRQRLSGLEEGVLRLLWQQRAIPLDQLALFLATDEAATAALVARLERRGLVVSGVGPEDEPAWVWVSEAGAALAGGPMGFAVPSLGGLARLREVNEVRLAVAEVLPGGRWVSRRELDVSGAAWHRVVGVVELGGERHVVMLDGGGGVRAELGATVERALRAHAGVVMFTTRGRAKWLKDRRRRLGWKGVAVRERRERHAQGSPIAVRPPGSHAERAGSAA